MNAWSPTAKPARRRAVMVVFWGMLPLVDAAYQITAKTAAMRILGHGSGSDIVRRAACSPWIWAMLACDAVGFVLWMVVLRDMKVSVAIPMSAASYILIIGAGWIGFREPVTAAQLIGGALVLSGVMLLRAEA